LKTKFFPTLEVLAVATAAYRLTGGKIIRANTVENEQELVANRVIIENHFNDSPIPVLMSDHRLAEEMRTYLEQTVIIQSLKGTPDRFLGQMSELVSKPEITNREFGLVAWAPHLAEQYRKKDSVREVSSRYEHHSRYVGHPRDKITTDFTLIEKRYVKSMDCWAVYGYDADDNLLFYWAKDLDKVCEVGKITGRIKDHKEDEYRNRARVTVLNYVKVL
jgi:hypothetical protein